MSNRTTCPIVHRSTNGYISQEVGRRLVLFHRLTSGSHGLGSRKCFLLPVHFVDPAADGTFRYLQPVVGTNRRTTRRHLNPCFADFVQTALSSPLVRSLSHIVPHRLELSQSLFKPLARGESLGNFVARMISWAHL